MDKVGWNYMEVQISHGCKVGCKVVVKFFGMMACIAHCDVAERLVSMDTLGWNYMEVQTADAK